MTTKRPNIPIIISSVLILSALLWWGIALVKIGEGDPGLAILVTVGVLGGILSLVAAAGVFAVKRWGIWLAIVLSLFGIFCSISGFVLWDTLPKGICTVGATIDVLVIVLTMLHTGRQASVSEQVGKSS